MHFPSKIQPMDFNTPVESARYEPVKAVAKSRFKRLFERPFANVLRTSAPEKCAAGVGSEEFQCNKDFSDEFEPSSVCLAYMVQNFIEETDKQSSAPVRCNRNRCNCFNGNCNDCSDDEFDSNHTSSTDACEILKSLVHCSSVFERNLLADAAKIVEKNKICKCKDDFCGKIVVDGLLALGYDASICKSRWEKASSYPAGEYDYVDVVKEGEERLIIDIDFRSEFEIARSTKTYKTILQTLPQIFVGSADRLQKIIYVVSEAAKQSLKKKGMPFPPWRKPEYVKSKWLSPYTRATPSPPPPPPPATPTLTIMDSTDLKPDSKNPLIGNKKIIPFDDIDRVNSPVETDHGDHVFSMSEDEA